jgi:4-amino-4-deoxy-L-arabinose transferase-like glycosyltransferase
MSRARARAWAKRRWPVLTVVAAATGLLALHLVWLHEFRSGYLTGWDESLYIAFALENTQSLRSGGLDSLASTVLLRPRHAPLVPVTTVPLHLIFGQGIDSSLAAGPAFFVLLVLATYGLARCLLPARWAALAALTVATAPVVTDYARVYHFSVPAAALFTAALWALLQSRGLSRKGWAIAAGGLLGLALLSRTMTLAYVPGFVLAAGALAVAAPSDRGHRLAVLCLMVLSAFGVAAIWYLPNLDSVGGYLFGAGYGAEATLYGSGHPVVSVGFWAQEVVILAEDLYLPLFALLALGVGVAAVHGLPRPPYARPTSPFSSRLRTWATTPAFALLVIVAGGYLALTSSANDGTAFGLPWLPALVVLAIAAIARIPSPLGRRALAIALVAVAVVNVVTQSGWLPSLGDPREVTVSDLGSVPIVDGRGYIHRGVEAAGYPLNPGTSSLPRLHRRWLPFSRELAGWMIHFADARGRTPDALFATRDPLFNNTRLALAAELWFEKPFKARPLAPAARGDPAETCRTRLTLAGNNFLVTADRGRAEITGCRVAKVGDAVHDLGFVPVRGFTLPDGRRLHVWWLDR